MSNSVEALRKNLQRAAERAQRDRKREYLSQKREKTIDEMTSRDWEEIMGVGRDTYKRGPGGAIRRK